MKTVYEDGYPIVEWKPYDINHERIHFEQLHKCTPEEFLKKWDTCEHPIKEGYTSSQMFNIIWTAKFLAG